MKLDEYEIKNYPMTSLYTLLNQVVKIAKARQEPLLSTKDFVVMCMDELERREIIGNITI